MSEIEVIHLEMTKNYNFVNWRTDIKRIVKKAGLGSKNLVFMFSDNQVKDESFLEDIAMLISTGEIPLLFEIEDLIEITNQMHFMARADDPLSKLTPEESYHKFIDRVNIVFV